MRKGAQVKKRFSSLLASIDVPFVVADNDPEIGHVTSDSRQAKEGSVFVAVAGARSDGHRFVLSAWRGGASAMIVQEGFAIPNELSDFPVVTVPDTRVVLARLAASLYGPLEEPMASGIVGLTGTNGKTSTTYMLEAILRGAGHRPGVIGTINYRVGEHIWPAPLTTPSAEMVWELFGKMATVQATHALMEVSSHALDQYRVDALPFRVVGFTNLTQDHLDYHGDFETYFAAKQRLFSELVEVDGRAVINADDPVGERLAASSRAPVWTYSVQADSQADMVATNVSIGIHGIKADVLLRMMADDADQQAPVMQLESPLLGAFHLHNLLLACGVALALGVDVSAVEAGVRSLASVPGRLERVPHQREASCGFPVLVDYAHTPDALTQILKSLRPLCEGRLIVVFGCGGDRDQGKRPLMGEAVATGADICLVTSDNPRTEQPEQIIEHIMVGVEPHMSLFSPKTAPETTRGAWQHPDRKEAIAQAIQMAQAGDIVVIAGKGHEEYQIIGETRFPFSDREVARAQLAQLP